MDTYPTHDFFRLFLETLPDGIILTDSDGTIVFVNRSAEKIRNVDQSHLVGSNILNCHHSESQEKVLRAVSYLQNHQDKVFHRMVYDNSNQKIYENTYSAVYNTLNELAGMAVVTRDCTESRRVEENRANSSRAQEIALENLKLQYHDLLMTSMEMLTNLLEARDVYTNGHSKRVSAIASKLYEYKYGISEQYLDIQWAAKLHDIGKICIPDRIINKPDKLTSEEYDSVKLHSSIAADILKTLDSANRVTPMIRHHHERYDGKGYPDGISGNDIPLGARIISIADAFDSMRSSRPYRQALPFDYCFDEIKSNSGRQFDPEWVDVFVELADSGGID